MSAVLIHEFRHAVRSLGLQPGFSALVIAVLAAGLACVLYVASIVNGLVIQPLPFAEPDGLYSAGLIDNGRPLDSDRFNSVTAGELRDWQDYLRDQAQVVGYSQLTINLSDGDRPERYAGGQFSVGLLEMLGVQPQLGRSFLPTDEQPGAAKVVLLSDTVWRNRFNADPTILGRQLRINSGPAEVIGVMPENFSFPWREQIWEVARFDPALPDVGDFDVLIRPRPGVSPSELRSQLSAWLADAGQARPDRMRSRAGGVGVKPLSHEFVDRETRGIFAVMAAAVALVLLIACANVANLMLSKLASRQQELALRIAIGATRRRLMLSLLMQTGLLSSAALLIALPLAYFAMRATLMLFHSAADDGPPHWMVFEIDAAVVLLSVLATALTALLSGWLPALRAAAADDLQMRSGNAINGGFARISRGLVIGQIAFSCAVLIAAAMLVQTVRQLDRFDLGLNTENVLTARMGLLDARFNDPQVLNNQIDALLRRLRAEPGVVDATLGNSLPGLVGDNIDILAQGAAQPENGMDSPGFAAVDPQFLQVMGATLIAGRHLNSADRADTAPVMLVDQTFVDRFIGDGEAIGKQFVLDPLSREKRTATIVGVIRPVQMDDIDDAIEPAVFVPLAQAPDRARFLSVFVRTRTDPMAFVERLRAIAAVIDPDAPLYWVRDYQQVLREATFGQRVLAQLFGGFGLIALLLAAAGLYGVIAFNVSQRTREIGVRRALGARDRNLLRSVLGRSAWQIGIGLALGLAIGIPFAGLLAAQITDGIEVGPLSWLPVLVVLALTGLLASWLPARRALNIEPTAALRYE